MKSKKIILTLAIVLLAVVGTLLWFRPKTVILPENCRLMVDTGEESLAEGMWIEDPEQKAQLLELLSAFRIRRYLSQPATDFPPGLALKFGDFARIEVYLPDTDQLTAYYTVSLIQPSMGTFTDISTQKRWKLTGRDEIAAVAAYITQDRAGPVLKKGEQAYETLCRAFSGRVAGASDGLRSFAAAGAGMWGGELVVRPAGRAI